MAPKTSLFPPNRQKIKRAEEARKNQIKTMGDLEFTADMQPQFVGQMTQEQKDFIGGENPEKSEFRKIFTYLDDPIAQYGFDPDRIRLEEPSKNVSPFDVMRNDYPKNKANAYYASGDVYTDKGIESDVIKYGVKLGSSKEIIAHEARHRGFQLLRNMQLEGSQEDQEAWVKKYGREAAGLLDIYFSEDARHRFSAESINEIRDRPDKKFNPPKFDAEGNPAGMGVFSKGEKNPSIVGIPLEDLRESEKTGTIKFSGTFKNNFSLSNEFINKAFQGLDQASKDAMKKQKDDYRKKMTVRSQEGKRKFANGGLTSHPSAMTADQYYDAESKKGVSEQTDKVLGYNSVPFLERPLDSDESDRIVGKDEAGNFIRQTILGNRYTVSLNPDQRTTRTKIEEDVIPAVKKFADDPRFPTMDEVVGAGTAVAKGAYDAASIPIDLLTGKRSPTEIQMQDVFDIAGGAAVGAGLQTLPDNAMGMFIGRKSAEIREGNSEPIFINEWKKLHGESPRTEEWDSGVDSPHVVAEVNSDINNFPETLKELKKVGWFEGRDGKLRREISDEPASFNPSALVSLTREEIRKVRFGGSKDNLSTLGDTLKHDNFFEQYPEFKDVPIIVDKSLKGTNTEGYFLPGSKIIAINPEVLADPKKLKALVLHEVMHLVQNKEKFSGGTNDESQDVVKFYNYEKNKPEAKAAWSKYENSLTELRKTFYPAALKKNKELFEFMLQRTARDEGVPIEKLRAAVEEDSKIIQAGKGGRSAIHDLADKEFQDWMDAGRPKRPLAKYPTEFPSISWANNLSSINNFLINKKPNGLDAEVEFAKDSMREANSIISTIFSDEDVKLFKKITGKSPIKKVADMTSDRFEGRDIVHSYADFIGLKDKPPERPLYVNPNEKFNDQKNTLFMLYQRNMGETEARNVSSRMDYTQEEIDAGSITKYDMDDNGFTNRQTKYIKPSNTEDIPADMQWNEKEFNKGGTAMKDQMEMSFALGGVAETVDPVSGNDVPPGSLPVEVRDDIPARLSEGEYVVPADVVRFFGVKFFEDIRMQAKMGLQQMEQDGRIGGEPVEPQQAEMSDEELNSIVEQAMQQEQPMMANEGGVVGYKHGGYHPPDFLGMSVFGDTTKKDDTSANQFYDVGDYKPTTGDYGTPETAAPTVTANVPDPVCPPGPNGERQRYDKDKGMCVVVSEGPDVIDPDPTPSTPFGEGVDWNNPKDVLKFANTLNTGLVTQGTATGLSLAAAAIPGAAPFALAGSLFSKADATRDVAGLKASRMISAALGQTDNANKIGVILEKYEKKFGDGFSGLLGIGTGLNSAASVLDIDKTSIKEFMEIYDNEGSSTEDKTKAQTVVRNLIIEAKGRKKEREEAAKQAAQEAANRATLNRVAEIEKYVNDRDDGSDSNIVGGRGEGPYDPLNPTSTIKGPTPSPTISRPTRTKKESYSQKISRGGGFKEGGLVQKRKKK